MTQTISSLLSLTALSFGLFSLGCKTECEKINGRTVCTTESLTQYLGTPSFQKADWSTGQSISVGINGGNVRLGSTAATVVQVLAYDAARGYGANQVGVEFTPVVAKTAEQRSAAIQEMNELLVLSLTSTPGQPVQVAVTRSEVSDSSLSASVKIFLPSAFDGGISIADANGQPTKGGILISNVPGPITAWTSTGDINISGARSEVNATTSAGDIVVAGAAANVRASTSTGDITVTEAAANVNASTQVGDLQIAFAQRVGKEATGEIVTGNGSISFTVKQDSDFSVTTRSRGEVIATTVPATWQAAGENSKQAKSFTANAGSTTPWRLDNSESAGNTNNITLTVVP